MSSASRVLEAALRLIDVLDGSDTRYALMGGLAIPIWGIPRATFDVDVVLSVDATGLAAFLDAARGARFVVAAPHATGFRDVLHGMEKLSLDWWTPESQRVEVDVFLVTTPYQEAAFARRCPVQIDGRSAWVLSAADLILHKLVASRPKDLADIQNILAVQGIPDAVYLRQWAARLGVADELARALETANLVDDDPADDEDTRRE